MVIQVAPITSNHHQYLITIFTVLKAQQTPGVAAEDLGFVGIVK